MPCPTRAIGQAVVICLAALAIGTVHALVRPVEVMSSSPTPPTPQPTGQGGGGNQSNTPTQPAPAVPNNPSPNAPTAVPPAPQPAPAAGNDRMITLARFKEMMSGGLPLQIIDAREPVEFAEGRIAGAINIPPGEFFGKVPDVVNQRLSRDLPVVVYCGGGNCDASKLVAVRLKDLGFSQTFVYEEGFTGWTKAGEAVEK